MLSQFLRIRETAIGSEKQVGLDPMPGRAELTISKRTVDGLSVESKGSGFGVRVYPSGRKIYVV